MTDRPELFVLRHGQTEWNAIERHQGRLDSPLTALGRRQAAAQGGILHRAGLADRDIDCFASPIGRAWTTAEIALAVIGKQAVADDRLVEVSFGDWEGLDTGEIDAGWPGLREKLGFFGWHFNSPGGEAFDALRQRAQAFLDELTGPAVIVTHGITARVLRGLWLGLDQTGMGAMPGGQGVVHHLKDGAQTLLGDNG